MKAIVLILLVGLACSQIVKTNFGCKNLSSDGVTCNECSNRFYKDVDGICQPVSTACKTYNASNGACTTCYNGFILIEVICIKDPKPQDPNCANFSQSVCNKCSQLFFLNANGLCELVDPLCKVYDFLRKECSECYGGYRLINKTCEVAPLKATVPGCSQFFNNICVKCARDYYMDPQARCILTDPSCKTFNSTNGNCLSCYDGHRLANNTCVIQVGASDSNCKTFQNGTCINCSNGYYFDANSRCVQIDPFCRSFDIPNRRCTQCYSGFVLSTSNVCVVDTNKKVLDSNCNQFDTNGNCVKCSQQYYFDSNGICIQIDPNCQSFDIPNRICTLCYEGFTLLANGKCIRTNVTLVAQANCAEEMQGVCLLCVERAYFDIDLKCVMVSDLCKTFNTFDGFCTSCYVGYALDSLTGQCLASDSATCIKSNPQTNVCTECVTGHFLDARSICQPIQVNCQTFNHTQRACQACYKGYRLNQTNNCQLAPIITAPTIQNCVNYDPTGRICVKCYNRYYLDLNQCLEADPLCKKFDSIGGACLTCYTGFTLSNQKCVFL